MQQGCRSPEAPSVAVGERHQPARREVASLSQRPEWLRPKVSMSASRKDGRASNAPQMATSTIACDPCSVHVATTWWSRLIPPKDACPRQGRRCHTTACDVSVYTKGGNFRAGGNALGSPSASWTRKRGAVVAKARELMRTVEARGEGLKQSPKGAINVCTLFNGMGSWIRALEDVSLPIGNIYVSEWEKNASEVTRRHWPAADVSTLPQDVSKITEEHVAAMGDVDLFIASPPCTDFSRLKKTATRDGRKGMAGPTGCLFRHTLQVWRWVRKHNPGCQFVIENVVFDDMEQDWKEVCDMLGEPQKLNSRDYGYAWRKRAFWSSMAPTPGLVESAIAPKDINDVLEPGRSHNGRV